MAYHEAMPFCAPRSIKFYFFRTYIYAASSLLALFGACSFGEVSPSGQPCGMSSCESRVSLTKTLAIASSDIPAVEIELCRKNVCVRTNPTKNANSGADFDFATYGPLRTTGTITPGAAGMATLALSFFADRAEDLSDGDPYSVRVGIPQQPLLLCIEEAIRYTESRPNGPSCAPLCRSAELSLPCNP